MYEVGRNVCYKKPEQFGNLPFVKRKPNGLRLKKCQYLTINNYLFAINLSTLIDVYDVYIFL